MENRRSIAYDELEDALHYFSVAELEELCKQYGLQIRVPAPLLKKPTLIKAIMTFVSTGERITYKVFLPKSSCAPKGSVSIDLMPSARILFGAYKNDLKTRIFMQKLVGAHFHFTVYGHEWIKERWMQGNPPTYQEFAEFWQSEYEARKEHIESPLKREWAYLNFLRDYRHEHPDTSQQKLNALWEKARAEKVVYAKELLLSLRRL